MISRFRRLTRGAAVVGATALIGAGALAANVPGHAATSFAFTRVAGATRFDTAAALAEQAFPGGAPTVLIATGFNFPDALAGNYLAGQDKAPILLVNSSGPLPAGTVSALSTLKTANVIILGLQAAVGDDVATELSSTASTSSAGGNIKVTRIGGATRYDTAQLIDTTPAAGAVGTYQGKKTAFLARGDEFPDALGAGPVAYATGFPIILTDPNTLSPQAAQTISALGIQQLLVLGGTAAISTSVETAADTNGVTTLARFAGANRSETSRLLADYAIKNFGFLASKFSVASGDENFGGADALASGPFSATEGPIPTLITNSVNDPGSSTAPLTGAVAFANEHAATEASGFAIGGTFPLPDSTLALIAAQITGTTTTQAFTVTPNTAQNVAVNAVVQYTVSGVGTAPVDIALFNCANTPQTGGATTFSGTNPGGSGNFAQQGTNTAKVTVLNGSATFSGSGTNQVNGVTAQNGQITFSVTDASPECVVPVVFAQGAAGSSTQNSLPLGTNNQPSVSFGTGGDANFLPPQATAGAFALYNSTTNTMAPAGPTNEAIRVNTTAMYFEENPGSGPVLYNYKTTDTYFLENATGTCVADTFTDFQARLSVADEVGGVYNPTGTSTFCLGDIAPAAPAVVTASPNTGQPAANTATGANAGGVTVSFSDSTTPTAASYNVYRAQATAPVATGAPYTCPTLASSLTSPQTPPGSSFTKIGSVTDANPGDYGTGGTLPGGSGTTYYYNDTTVSPVTASPQVQFCYAVTTVDAGGQEGSGNPAVSNATGGVVPAAASSGTGGGTGFKLASATATANQVTVLYTQAVNATTVDANGSDFTVSSTAGGVTTAQTVLAAAPSGSNGVLITVTPPTTGSAFPSGATVLVTSKAGLDANTVCAANSTTTCDAVGDSVQTTVGSSTTVPAFTAAVAVGTAVTVTYNEAITCASVDTNGSDFSATTGGAADVVTAATCAGTTSPTVVLTLTSAPALLATVTITAKVGADGNTVLDSSGNAQAVGNSVTSV